MKVSVAIAAYEGERFIGAQLDSLARQSRRPDQIVVTDDSRGGGTEFAVLSAANRTGLCIEYSRNASTLGVAKNFQAALARCDGDVTFLCDQDDVWDPKKIETVLAAFSEAPALLCVMNDARFTDGDLHPTGRTKRAQFSHAGLEDEVFVMGCCAAFDQDLVRVALPFPDKVTHDQWIVGLSDVLGSTNRLTAVLQDYRIHGGNEATFFFINRSAKRGRLAMYLLRLRRTLASALCTSGLEAELQFLESALNRLEERYRLLASRFGKQSIDAKLQTLRIRIQRLRARREVHSQRRLERAGTITKLWREGVYDSPRAAVKDLLVRRLPPLAKVPLP